MTGDFEPYRGDVVFLDPGIIGGVITIDTNYWIDLGTGSALNYAVLTSGESTVVGIDALYAEIGTVDLMYRVIDLNGCEASVTVEVYIKECVENDTIHTTFLGTDDFKFEAMQLILADNKIYPSSEIIYKAGKSILLKQGFEVKKGASFDAQIGGCPD